ncbi:MAG: TAXI family TRAP transporter solute-binding subunit [candidate division NC10 bacterium]|nr:TAXI family TRAP transporter solute-binding subunit [candidate division NC10 bacterium]
MKRVSLVLALVLALVVCLGGAAEVLAQGKVDLKMMTGPMGGSWYPLGGAIGELIQKEIPGASVSVQPGGGIGNVMAVQEGKTDIGFGNSSSSVDGVAGRPPFKGPTNNVMQLANLYPQYFQMVVLADSGINSVADLKGKAICPGPKGQTGEQLSREMLQIYGLSYADMSKINHVSYSDGVALMKDGHAQGFLLGTTIPASSILDLATNKKIRLLSIPDDKIKELQKMNAGYLKRVIPKGTYPGIDVDTPGVGYFTHLVISAKLPEDLVYKITKLLCTHVDRLAQVVKDMQGVKPADLALNIGVPFHPGALKYYKEIGAIK